MIGIGSISNLHGRYLDTIKQESGSLAIPEQRTYGKDAHKQGASQILIEAFTLKI